MIDIKQLQDRVEGLERRVILDELRAVAQAMNINQAVVKKNLFEWADGLCLMDGAVCFIIDGDRLGTKNYLSAWLRASGQ